jgi:hypothetical protein
MKLYNYIYFIQNIDMLHYIISPYMYPILNLIDRLKSILLPPYVLSICRLSRELDMIANVPIVVHEPNGP